MGLGKTVQCLAALRILFDEGRIRQVLVVVPSGLVTQWRRELERWAPSISVIRIEGPPHERRWKWKADRQVYLASYETIRNDATALDRTWDLVVLDEAQRIKNRSSLVAQVCKRLRRRRAWALTGTPLENTVNELASVLEFVRQNEGGSRLPPLMPGFRLQSRQLEVQLRRRKVDVLTELPPKTVERVLLDLTAGQRAAYDALERSGRRHLETLGAKATVLNVLELITRLKAICNFCPDSGTSSKLVDLRERLACLRDAGHRALLFSQWRNEAHGVMRLAAELAPFRPLVYTGTQTLSERTAVVDRFVRDKSWGLLALSLRAGGQGLNLQCASYVFHFDRWWNPAVENQATDRSHRMGQQHPVTVIAYTCADTIEERIEQILDRKRQLFAALVDLVSLDVRRLLSDQELFGLFGLEAPRRRLTPAVEGAFAERVMRLLQGCGWSVRLGREVWTASAWDEVGLRKDACLRVVGGRVADVDDVAQVLPQAERRVVICDQGFSDRARTVAAEHQVALWSTEDLAQLEGGPEDGSDG
jgi:SNF2 family DNA or RNA helicase